MLQRTVAKLHRLRLASILALASLVLAIASTPVEAHSLHGYTVDFIKLYSVKESGEVGSDEPYVIMAVVNFATKELVLHRTSVFGDVDTGESRLQTVRLWGPTGTAVPFPGANPDNLIVLVVAMEHDDCRVDGVVSAMDTVMRSKLGELGSATRDVMVSGLQDAMFKTASVGCVLAWPWQTADDWVGLPKELRITAADLSTAHAGTTVEKVLEHDGNNTHYRTYFRLQAAPSVLLP